MVFLKHQVAALTTDLMPQRKGADWVRIVLLVRRAQGTGPHGAPAAQRVIGAQLLLAWLWQRPGGVHISVFISNASALAYFQGHTSGY